MKILMVDNYDSFTYNLVHYLEMNEGVEVDVIRNDKLDFNNMEQYDKIMLSPGPGIPEEAGDLFKVIRTYAGKKPIMGVCLGHQAIAEVFGAELENMSDVYHGLAHVLKVVKEDAIFKDLPKSFKVGRYHSWQVKNDEKLATDFEVIGLDESDQVMAIRHKALDLVGVQFHPESILTEYGHEMINNWIFS